MLIICLRVRWYNKQVEKKQITKNVKCLAVEGELCVFEDALRYTTRQAVKCFRRANFNNVTSQERHNKGGPSFQSAFTTDVYSFLLFRSALLPLSSGTSRRSPLHLPRVFDHYPWYNKRNWVTSTNLLGSSSQCFFFASIVVSSVSYCTFIDRTWIYFPENGFYKRH